MIMRVLHLSTSDIKGGAARGSYALHETLHGLGISSQMLVGRKYTDDSDVHEMASPLSKVHERLRGILDALPLKKYSKSNESYWTVGWLPRVVRRSIAAFRPEIVHIHWTGGGFLPITALRQIDVPIVWTVRDMWPFTGGCHYSNGCNNYINGCGLCPQLSSNRTNDLSRRIWRGKRKSWQDIEVSVVPISNWLADCVRDSGIFERGDITVIPNGIDTTRFRPHPPEYARQKLGIRTNGKRQILYGALGAISDKRKGFDKLVEAIRRIRLLEEGDNYTLNIFGTQPGDELPDLGIETRSFGRIDNDDTLAELYAACDVMVTPSLQEAFGKTLVEAMACGTPVVAFDFGGPSDIVQHKRTGYLAEPFDTADLAAGIGWCVESDERISSLSAAARMRAETRFDRSLVGLRYLELYQQLLERTS